MHGRGGGVTLSHRLEAKTEDQAVTSIEGATEERGLTELAADLDRNYRTYSHYNAQRVFIMRRLTPPARSLLLQAIPFLFHVNDARIPGYVKELGDNIGVHGFKPNEEVRNVRKQFFAKHQAVSAGLSRQPMIESIASIGSAGTLAQTDHSDFDLWIICRSDISRGDYNLIAKKAELIKEWLLQQDPELDLNFYPATPADVRRHHFGAVSDDSAGSALGTFLKEEFYRTVVVWVGKLPFWWILPPAVREPSEYEEWLAGAKEADLEFMTEIMDMGPLVRSSPEKFLSAVLWQTNKSLKSPFKSLLKLTVVSRYGDEPNGKFIAEMVRQRVLEDTSFGGGTDPYLCLFEFCAEYWKQRGDPEGTRLMAENFYMKMLGGQGATGASEADVNDIIAQRRRLARNMLRDWGLSHTDMQDLSAKDTWGFQKGLEYHERTEEFVKRIFDRVMMKLDDLGIRFVDGKVETSRDDVEPAVLRMLGEFSNISHKVDCFYGHSQKKVQPIPPSFRDILAQSSYTMSFSPTRPRWEQWALTEDIPEALAKKEAAAWGKAIDKDLALNESAIDRAAKAAAAAAQSDTNGTGITGGTSDSNRLPSVSTAAVSGTNPGTESKRAKRGQLLQRGASILSLMSWLCVNRLVAQGSNLNVIIDGERRPVSEVRRLITKLVMFLKHPLYMDALPESTFKQPPQPYRIFVSFDLVQHSQLLGPESLRSTPGGDTTVRISSRQAVFSASDIKRITLAEQDTYGVVRIHDAPTTRYSCGVLMARILRRLQGVPLDQLDDRVQFHGADTPYHRDFARDFEGALRRAHQELSALTLRKNFGVRYVTCVGGRFIVLTRLGEGELRGQECADFNAVMALLERSTGVPTQTIVDPVVEGPERLRSMFSRWIPGRIQVFVHRGAKSGSIHVIDEMGCFYNERLPLPDLEPQLAHLLVFLAKLGGAPLKHALRVDGKIQFKVWEIADSVGGEVGYHYAVNPYVAKNPQITQQVAASTVFLRFTGSLNFTEAHTLELIVGASSKSMDLPGEGIAENVAMLLRRLLKTSQLKDFSIAGLEKNGERTFPSHLVEYLALRRGLDRAFRRAIAGPASQPITGKVVGS